MKSVFNFLTDFSKPLNLSNSTLSLFSGSYNSGWVSSIPKNISSSSYKVTLESRVWLGNL